MEYARTDEQTGAAESRPHRGAGDRRLLAQTAALAVFLTLLVLVVSLATRALWPHLDGAPLAAAWEMWSAQQFLLPTANGVLAPQPPLFLWAIHGGWAVAGVNEWWPRLLPAVLMLATLVLTYRLARAFWPRATVAAQVAPVVLAGAGGWLVAGTFVGTHVLLVLVVMLGYIALFIAGRHRDGRAWLLLGVALGIGMLGAGPVVLLYLLPPALLAPMWLARKPQPVWSHWYGDLAKSLVLGAGIFLVWFIPASQATSAPLSAWHSLFSIGSPLSTVTVHDVAFPLLGLAMFLPWAVWPWVWGRVWSLRRVPLSPAVRFALCTLVPVLAFLLWFAPAQPLALLPLLPLAAALIAGLTDDSEPHRDGALGVTMILPVMLLGAALVVLPMLPRVDWLPAFLWSLSPAVGIAIVLVAIAIAWLPLRPLRARIVHMAATSAALVSLALVGFGWQFNAVHDATEVAQRIAVAQQAGRPVAQVGPYAGEYHFLGRLRAPLAVVTPAQAADWLRDHPQGWLVSDMRLWRPPAQLHASTRVGPRLRIWDITDFTVTDFVPPVASP